MRCVVGPPRKVPEIREPKIQVSTNLVSNWSQARPVHALRVPPSHRVENAHLPTRARTHARTLSITHGLAHSPNPSLPCGASSGPLASQPSEGAQIIFFHCLELHHTQPDAGELQCKSRDWTRRFDPVMRASSAVRGRAPPQGTLPSTLAQLSSEYGTYKTVKARIRPWLAGQIS